MVMIVVDLSQPWTIMESLQRWAEVVLKHVNSLQISPQERKDMEENCESLPVITFSGVCVILSQTLLYLHQTSSQGSACVFSSQL